MARTRQASAVIASCTHQNVPAPDRCRRCRFSGSVRHLGRCETPSARVFLLTRSTATDAQIRAAYARRMRDFLTADSLALIPNTRRDRVVPPCGRALRQPEKSVTTTIVHHDWNYLITPSFKGNSSSLSRSSSCRYALVGEHSFPRGRICQFANGSHTNERSIRTWEYGEEACHQLGCETVHARRMQFPEDVCSSR